LLFVHLSTRRLGTSENLGDSVHLLEALDYVPVEVSPAVRIDILLDLLEQNSRGAQRLPRLHV